MNAYLLSLLQWALLNLAWQGVVSCLACVAALRLLARAQAESRYRWAGAALTFLCLAPVATLLASHAFLTARIDAGTGAAMGTASRFNIAALQDRYAAWLSFAGWLWIVGAMSGMVILAFSWLRLRRMIRSAEPNRDARLESLVGEEAQRVGLERPPEILVGPMGPLVAGAIHPVLVVTPDLRARMSELELRALLLHELSHIRRRDYAANLVRRVMLAALWIHPTAWILAAWLAREREYCCDSLAARLCGSGAALGRALLKLEESRPMVLSMGAGYRATDRMRRLLNRTSGGRLARTGAWAVSVASLLLMACGILGVARAFPNCSAALRSYASSPWGPNRTIEFHAHDPAGRFFIRMVRGRATDVSINGSPVPQARLVQHGDRLTVSGPAGESLLNIHMDPLGRIAWSPRPPRR